ncbi:hypothetical protein QUB80_11985 [Chlorogloeopsis sp. ULAP01]|uniref:hypothetical protein n=1 Tax=Chlorogloeopsis sp. ULAP01 TaxID=3056483 RepID=UPI0025AAB042|nr:hypothetical protein [Chlorogloeopsis sp. ULAP01]MDM9381421.1 hypothetical protein [Chlorogloeopsis sp. ULAP01]
MISHLVLFSFLIVTITIVIAPKTYAQSTDTCTFSQISSGELVGDGGTLPTQLVSFSTAGGSPTQISVNCKEPVSLSVSEPIQIAGPAFQPVSSLVTVETANGGSTNSRSGSPLSLPVGTTPVVINLFVDKGSLLAPGNYRYGIKFTIVP